MRSLTQRTTYYYMYMRHVMTVVHVFEREKLNISVRKYARRVRISQYVEKFYNFTLHEIKSLSLSLFL